jgi:hypothetical protein
LLKKTIEYEDFNGLVVFEDHYFHLSKAELVEMEMAQPGGMGAYLQSIVKSEDGKAIISEFKKIILESYGKRSEDGKRFIKTQELRDEFYSSQAYSELFMELCTDAEKAAEFINGIIPAGLEQDVAKMTKEDSPVKLVEAQELSLHDAAVMDGDELRSGLATGKYKLS